MLGEICRQSDLTRLNKIAIQGTALMEADKEAICLSRVYSDYSSIGGYDLCPTPEANEYYISYSLLMRCCQRLW